MVVVVGFTSWLAHGDFPTQDVDAKCAKLEAKKQR